MNRNEHITARNQLMREARSLKVFCNYSRRQRQATYERMAGDLVMRARFHNWQALTGDTFTRIVRAHLSLEGVKLTGMHPLTIDTDNVHQVSRAARVLEPLGYRYHSTDPAAGTTTYEVAG